MSYFDGLLLIQLRGFSFVGPLASILRYKSATVLKTNEEKCAIISRRFILFFYRTHVIDKAI